MSHYLLSIEGVSIDLYSSRFIPFALSFICATGVGITDKLFLR